MVMTSASVVAWVHSGGSAHAVDHLLAGDDLLARTVAAALGADLVFDVGGGGASLSATKFAPIIEAADQRMQAAA